MLATNSRRLQGEQGNGVSRRKREVFSEFAGITVRVTNGSERVHNWVFTELPFGTTCGGLSIVKIPSIGCSGLA